MVKILAISDLHGTEAGFKATHALLSEHKPDALVLCGDITHFGPASWARKFLGSIEIPMLAVNGNCDTDDVSRVIASNEKANLLNLKKELFGLNFVGLAYPPRLWFDESFGRVDVLVSHAPPLGCNDALPGGGSIGDRQVREIVLRFSPRLVLSGHVHEARGIVKLGECVCVNPGPAKNGFGSVIEIGNDVGATLVQARY
jgi:Icc-related predicted phosphoesterase